ncbi:hypothetical protein [Thermoflavimicrobium dichotomicum]|uniref:hypothetical protein n=1 Tax=Thermoflavimicrobium dichotomicum TaxID=46223 RepID=UPI00158774AB|nr:hypothetical protein [Thermoflavimicrobium dichotomicum]
MKKTVSAPVCHIGWAGIAPKFPICCWITSSVSMQKWWKYVGENGYIQSEG